MTSNLSLHKAVFEEDFERVEQILKTLKAEEINKSDIHGNTALHIAAMKGNRRCVQLLVKSGAKTNITNELNWMPLQEAISYGDFQITKIIAEKELLEAANVLRRDKLLEVIKVSKHDYVMKFEIRRKDYKPTMGNIPTQAEATVTLFKKGVKARFDVDITDAIHSDPIKFTFVFDFNDDVFMLILRWAPIYQIITLDAFVDVMSHIIKEHLIDTLASELLKKDNVANSFQVDQIHANQPLFRKIFSKKVADFHTDLYETKGLDLVRKVRTEHLTARNESNEEQSLRPPEPRNISWDQYVNASKGQFPYLGRKPIETIQTNRVSIVIGISKEVPLNFNWKWIVDFSIDLMDYKFPESVSDQIKSLPEGFPTLIDLPFHRSTEYLKWKLVSCDIVSDLSDTLFNVPDGFRQTEIIPIEHQTQRE